MPHPTTARPKNKPAAPHDDFPVIPHATMRWVKKIRGKMHYFGPWEDSEAALKHYHEQRDDLHVGRSPPLESACP